MNELKTACGGTILVTHRTQEHLLAHPDVVALLPEVIARIALPSSGLLEAEVNMCRVVGRSGRITTKTIRANERAFFAKRIGRDFPSRVAPLGVLGSETSTVTVIAFPDKVDPRTYVLMTSYIGTRAPQEPWDQQITNETVRAQCLDFWCRNALVYVPSLMGSIFASTWSNVLSHESERSDQ